MSENATVLLAIAQCFSRVTPTEMEKLAKTVSSFENIKYDGPIPNFKNEKVFASAWNELLSTDIFLKVGSNKLGTPSSEPIFRIDTDIDALDIICDTRSEKESFDRALMESKYTK